jgi:hypothetical protein
MVRALALVNIAKSAPNLILRAHHAIAALVRAGPELLRTEAQEVTAARLFFMTMPIPPSCCWPIMALGTATATRQARPAAQAGLAQQATTMEVLEALLLVLVGAEVGVELAARAVWVELAVR